jgi:hypothetical protein
MLTKSRTREQPDIVLGPFEDQFTSEGPAPKYDGPEKGAYADYQGAYVSLPGVDFPPGSAPVSPRQRIAAEARQVDYGADHSQPSAKYVRALAVVFRRHAGAPVMVRRRGGKTMPERALTLSDVVRFCHESEVHLVHSDLLAAFNNAAEFVDGRSLVTPECLERLVANLATAKFPESEPDVAVHLFFQRYVRPIASREL